MRGDVGPFRDAALQVGQGTGKDGNPKFFFHHLDTPELVGVAGGELGREFALVFSQNVDREDARLADRVRGGQMPVQAD
jgi:hypothetical protein